LEKSFEMPAGKPRPRKHKEKTRTDFNLFDEQLREGKRSDFKNAISTPNPEKQNFSGNVNNAFGTSNQVKKAQYIGKIRTTIDKKSGKKHRLKTETTHWYEDRRKNKKGTIKDRRNIE